MKLLLFLAAIFCSCAVISCGHKDDNAKPSAQIIGKWNGDKMYEMVYQGDQLIDGDTVFITSPDYYTIEFKSANTVAINMSIQGNQDHESGYYTLQGKQIFVGGTADDPDKEAYDYVLKGNSLELKDTENDTLNNQILRYEEHIFFKKAE